jgi:acetyl esterase/lipase
MAIEIIKELYDAAKHAYLDPQTRSRRPSDRHGITRIAGAINSGNAPALIGQKRPGDTYEILNPFKTERFSGFVASDDHKVLVAFRGTTNDISDEDTFVDTVRQWLCNLDYAQISKHNALVHRGFDREVDSAYAEIKRHVKEHGGTGLPVYVSGHSAGGALAVIAARRLYEDGLAPKGVMTFSAPRVGNKRYRDTYPIPVFRFENMDDLVPHVPFPAGLTNALRNISPNGWKIIGDIVPKAGPYLPGNVEYAHVGQLFFVDWDGDLIRAVPNLSATLGEFGEAVGRAMTNWLTNERVFERPMDLPGTPMPINWMNIARVGNVLSNVVEQACHGKWKFITDHCLDTVSSVIDTVHKEFGQLRKQ